MLNLSTQAPISLDIKGFCKAFSSGRSTDYKEIAAGRLSYRKVGKRTHIPTADAKYADHLSLCRQSRIFAREAIDLDRSTLEDWGVGRRLSLSLWPV